jgi:anthranilate synthase
MLGAPHNRRPSSGTFTSDKGVEVTFDVKSVVNPDTEVDKLVDLIDNQVGVLLTSSYEYPGRYSRWTVGFVAPALQIEGL